LRGDSFAQRSGVAAKVASILRNWLFKDVARLHNKIFVIGREVKCEGGALCGLMSGFAIDLGAKRATHLVVEQKYRVSAAWFPSGS
jgi:hypothetical protein